MKIHLPISGGYVKKMSPMSHECKILLHKLIDAVYKTGNIASIEDSLECLADALDVEIPDSNTKIKITSSEKIYSDIKMFAVA
jgi:hypothetical protein